MGLRRKNKQNRIKHNKCSLILVVSLIHLDQIFLFLDPYSQLKDTTQYLKYLSQGLAVYPMILVLSSKVYGNVFANLWETKYIILNIVSS